MMTAGMDPGRTTVLDAGQMKAAHEGQRNLQKAVEFLHDWQRNELRHGRKIHGRCLSATRAALRSVGLVLPPAQTKKSRHDTALWCGRRLVAAPEEYGWVRQKPPFPRYSLDVFRACGYIDDVDEDTGEEYRLECGHIAVCDHSQEILFSSFNYALSRRWLQRRFASFIPAP